MATLTTIIFIWGNVYIDKLLKSWLLSSNFILNIIILYFTYNIVLLDINSFQLNSDATLFVLFQGAREVKHFINFIKREASKPLVLNGVKEEL